MDDFERRMVDESVEIRSDNGINTVVGYAAVFNSLSKDLGGFKEIIKPGAFRSALDSGMEVRALINHDRNFLLGTRSAGTLRVQEDSKGLRYEVDLPDTSYARDLSALISRGDMRGSSFGFVVGKDKFITENRQVTREIESFKKLVDVSVVDDPAYAAASVVSMRSFNEFANTLPQEQKMSIYSARLRLLGLGLTFGN